MKTGLIIPVSEIDKEPQEVKRHLECEFGEFCEAWQEYLNEPSGKKLAHVLEELIDLATCCITLAYRLEVEHHINGLVNMSLLMVACKNYMRNYHKINPIKVLNTADLFGLLDEKKGE